jgi:hypothetical protein
LSVEQHVIEIFEHFAGIGMCASDVFRVSENRGLSYTYGDINTVCKQLTEQGTIVKIRSRYGISIQPDGSLYEIIRPVRKKPRLAPQSLSAKCDELISIRRAYQPKPKRQSIPKQPRPRKPYEYHDKPKLNILQLATEWDKFDGSWTEFQHVQRVMA